MRQRKVRNLEKRLAEHDGMNVHDPAELKGKWRDFFARSLQSGEICIRDESNSSAPELYVEIGCGKGKFISELAARERDKLFVAIEGNPNAILRAMEKVKASGLTNVVFVSKYIEDISLWFEAGEVSGIYLNFSDPLPKSRTAKNRLTHRKKLAQYFDILAEDGIVVFKTDNDGLFEFTLEEIYASDLEITELIRDMHALKRYEEEPGGLARYGLDISGDIRTEYEYKFSELGEKIKRVIIARKGNTDKNRGDNDMEVNVTKTIFAAANGRLIPKSAYPKIFKEKTKAQCFDFMSRVYGTIEIPKDINPFIPVLSNYSCPGDKVLVWEGEADEYACRAMELSRRIETYSLTREIDGETGYYVGDDADCELNTAGKHNFADLEYRIGKLLRIQDRLLIQIKYIDGEYGEESFNSDDLAKIVEILSKIPADKRVTLYVDATFPPDKDDVMMGFDLKPFDRMGMSQLLMMGNHYLDEQGVIEEREIVVLGGNIDIVDEALTFSIYSTIAFK